MKLLLAVALCAVVYSQKTAWKILETADKFLDDVDVFNRNFETFFNEGRIKELNELYEVNCASRMDKEDVFGRSDKFIGLVEKRSDVFKFHSKEKASGILRFVVFSEHATIFGDGVLTVGKFNVCDANRKLHVGEYTQLLRKDSQDKYSRVQHLRQLLMIAE